MQMAKRNLKRTSRALESSSEEEEEEEEEELEPQACAWCNLPESLTGADKICRMTKRGDVGQLFHQMVRASDTMCLTGCMCRRVCSAMWYAHR